MSMRYLNVIKFFLVSAIVLNTSSTLATSKTNANILDIHQLTVLANGLGITIKSLDQANNLRVWNIKNEGVNRNDLLTEIKKQHSNVLISEGKNAATVFLLPSGLDAGKLAKNTQEFVYLTAAARLASPSEIKPYLGSILEAPTVKVLETIGKLQKPRTLKVQRTVNPQNIHQWYSFNAEFDVGRGVYKLFPTGGNGIKPGNLDSFISFATVYDYIKDNTHSFTAEMRGDQLLLRPNGSTTTFIALQGTNESFEVIIRAETGSIVPIENYIKGSASQYEVITSLEVGDTLFHYLDQVEI